MNNRGFTLVEIVMALAIVTILSLMAVPRLTSAREQSAVTSARDRVVTLYNVARTGAVSSGRRTTLNLSGDKAWVTATPRQTPACCGEVDTLGSVTNLAATYGVKMASSTSTIGFDVRGLGIGLGGDGTLVKLTRGYHEQSVEFSGYGKVIR